MPAPRPGPVGKSRVVCGAARVKSRDRGNASAATPRVKRLIRVFLRTGRRFRPVDSTSVRGSRRWTPRIRGSKDRQAPRTASSSRLSPSSRRASHSTHMRCRDHAAPSQHFLGHRHPEHRLELSSGSMRVEQRAHALRIAGTVPGELLDMQVDELACRHRATGAARQLVGDIRPPAPPKTPTSPPGARRGCA